MSPREPVRAPACNCACPVHGPSYVFHDVKASVVVCTICDWSKPYDHRDVLTARLKPVEVR